MRMARAFIASIPLAIVLVAALVVPLMVIPGTFGFQSWPRSLGAKVSEHRVQVAPAPAAVAVRVRKSHPTAAPPRGHVSQTPVRKITATPAPAATHVHGHRATVVVVAPHGSGPGRTDDGSRPSSPDAPAQTPSAPPAQPAPPPASPGTIPAPDTVASEAPPIAREDPAANPAPTPPPA